MRHVRSFSVFILVVRCRSRYFFDMIHLAVHLEGLVRQAAPQVVLLLQLLRPCSPWLAWEAVQRRPRWVSLQERRRDSLLLRVGWRSRPPQQHGGVRASCSTATR